MLFYLMKLVVIGYVIFMLLVFVNLKMVWFWNCVRSLIGLFCCLMRMLCFWMLSCVLFRYSWLVGWKGCFMVFKLCYLFSKWWCVCSCNKCVRVCCCLGLVSWVSMVMVLDNICKLCWICIIFIFRCIMCGWSFLFLMLSYVC